MSKLAKTHVKNLERSRSVGGGRRGTIWTEAAGLLANFHRTQWPDEEGKVSIGFTFDTPRGVIELTDYWWNDIGFEWSIRTENKKAIIWLVKYLKGEGLELVRGGPNPKRTAVNAG